MSNLKRILEVATRPETGRLGDEKSDEERKVTATQDLALSLLREARRTFFRVQSSAIGAAALAGLGIWRADSLGLIFWAAAMMAGWLALRWAREGARAAMLGDLVQMLDPDVAKTVATMATHHLAEK